VLLHSKGPKGFSTGDQRLIQCEGGEKLTYRETDNRAKHIGEREENHLERGGAGGTI